MDCGHGTAYSGTICGPEGQIEARKAEADIKGKITKDILSLGLYLCVTMTSQQQRNRNFSSDSMGKERVPSDDGYYQGMLKATDGRKGNQYGGS